MAWTVEFLPQAAREPRKLDRQLAAQRLRFLGERVRRVVNPRSIGQPARARWFGAHWNFRVGDYRLIRSLQDSRIVVAAVRIGHWSDVCRD
jgi:mRNA interferase RelE/StbE